MTFLDLSQQPIAAHQGISLLGAIQAVGGIVALLLIAYLCSNNRKAINWGSPRHLITGRYTSSWWNCCTATYCIFVQQQPKSHQLENSRVWFIVTTCIGDKYFKAKLGTEHLQCRW